MEHQNRKDIKPGGLAKSRPANKRVEEMNLKELWTLFPITLQKHNPQWSCWFEEEKRSLEEILPQSRIHHIGSTAIPSIRAKPIVDILVECDDLILTRDILEKKGYLCMNQDSKRISMNKGYTPEGYDKRVFHIHLIPFSADSHKTIPELIFRNRLLQNPDLAREYEALKMQSWKEHPFNRDAYTKAKTEFVLSNSRSAKENS